jgi:hypothetical protein
VSIKPNSRVVTKFLRSVEGVYFENKNAFLVTYFCNCINGDNFLGDIYVRLYLLIFVFISSAKMKVSIVLLKNLVTTREFGLIDTV